MGDGSATTPRRVRVAPADDAVERFTPFEGLLGRTPDDRAVLKVARGQTAPVLMEGQRLRLVPDDGGPASSVVVVGPVEGDLDAIEVAAATDATTRRRRATQRVASPLEVALVVDGDERPAVLRDVARGGAGLAHAGDPLEPGTSVELRIVVGRFASNARAESVTGRVVRSGRAPDGGVTTGVRFDEDQSATVTRVMMVARRRRAG